jgi:hypothetical protein
MYEYFEAFRIDALACGETYYTDVSLKPQNIEAAFEVYQNAKKGTTLLDADGRTIQFGVTIVGRLALKVTTRNETGEEKYLWLPSDESFPSIDKILQENLGTLAEGSADVIGSILDAKRWSLLANDAWLIGGIHAKTEYHFASPLSWKNLWDDGVDRLTVTAREVIGITAHGYEISRPHPNLEAVATWVDEQRVLSASLITYKNHVQKCSNKNAFLKFFKSLPSSATANG